MDFANIDTSKYSEEQKKELLNITSSKELEELLKNKEEEPGIAPEEDYSTEIGAILGGSGETAKSGYPLGKSFLPAAPAGVFALLTMIRSPLIGLGDATDDEDAIHAYRAAFVICAGREALAPVMGLSARIKACRHLEPWADKSQANKLLFMAHLDNLVHDAWAEFDNGALAYCADRFGEVLAGQVLAMVNLCLTDAMSGISFLPSSSLPDTEEQTGSKKN